MRRNGTEYLINPLVNTLQRHRIPRVQYNIRNHKTVMFLIVVFRSNNVRNACDWEYLFYAFLQDFPRTLLQLPRRSLCVITVHIK